MPSPSSAARAKANGPKALAKRAALRGITLPDEHTPSEGIAHEICVEFNDLLPSVNRIMSAGLTEEGAMRAITLFRDSLTVPGDENRNPAVAIEAGRKFGGSLDS